MSKLKIVAFTIATDPKNQEYAKMMINSWNNFHPDIPLLVWDDVKCKKYDDPLFFLRATPTIAYELMKDYDLVIQTNADQIITGNLDYVLKGDYDVGTVYNYNPTHTKKYGPISCIDIPNMYYYNNGFIAMRSKRFITNWYNLCYSYHFGNYQYREQDLLNILCYYGDYKVKCFDEYDPTEKYSAWHGLRSTGEWHKAIMRDGKLILPANGDGYPERDKELKILHWAEGANAIKMNFRTYFNEECIKYINWLVSDEPKKTKNTV